MASSQHPSSLPAGQDGRQAHANAGTKTNGGGDGGDGGLGKGGVVKKGSKRGKIALNESNHSPTSMTFSMSPVRSPELVDEPVKSVRSRAIEMNDMEKLKLDEKNQRTVSFVPGLDNGNGESLDFEFP